MRIKWNNSKGADETGTDGEEEQKPEKGRDSHASGKGDFVLRGVVKVTPPLSRRSWGIKQTDALRRGPRRIIVYGASPIAILDKEKQRGDVRLILDTGCLGGDCSY